MAGIFTRSNLRFQERPCPPAGITEVDVNFLERDAEFSGGGLTPCDIYVGDDHMGTGTMENFGNASPGAGCCPRYDCDLILKRKHIYLQIVRRAPSGRSSNECIFVPCIEKSPLSIYEMRRRFTADKEDNAPGRGLRGNRDRGDRWINWRSRLQVISRTTPHDDAPRFSRSGRLRSQGPSGGIRGMRPVLGSEARSHGPDRQRVHSQYLRHACSKNGPSPYPCV
jgi:hypothetical protein